MKSILFVIPWLPYPMISGGHQALFNGIAAIKEDFHIYITYETEESDEYRKAEKDFLKSLPQVHVLPLVRGKKKETSLLIRLFRKIKRMVFKPSINPSIENSYLREKWWIRTILPLAPDFIEHIHRICKEFSFDIIQVEMPWYVSAVLSLPGNAKKVYVHHELGFVRRELEVSQNPSEYAKVCKKFVDYNELALLNKYDTIITLSPSDTNKLKEAGVSAPVKSSFAIIDSPTNPEIITCNGKSLTFIGPDSHGPNINGITWFLDNCWRKLKEYNKDYKLYIIGKWSDKHIQDYKKKYADISFLGFVPDLVSVIKGTIMIVPITIGSGIRMKILEACSCGIPFVSTSIGAEGIPLQNGKDCFITDNPDEFVADIIKLQNTELQAKFATNANAMVRKYFSIDALRQNRINIYDNVLTS